MTQEELNNKISKVTNQIQNQKDKLQDLINDIAEKTTALEKLKAQGEAANEQTLTNIAAADKAIATLTEKKATLEKAIASDEKLLEEYKTITPTETSGAKEKTAIEEMTQSDKAKNEKLAAEHPERTVDGIYYADDEALASAKAAQEQRIQSETKLANAEATANANKLAAAMKVINETLYGTDNQEVLTQLQGTVGGAELSSILGNAVSVRARQHLLDFKKFKDDFKAPNTGKPPNNKDPFPVDLKIEEFETHQPRVKVHQI